MISNYKKNMTISFYDYFNRLNSTEDCSYFKEPLLAIEPINEKELRLLNEFKQTLVKHNSLKIYEYICQGIWQNTPVIFIPKDKFHFEALNDSVFVPFNITPVEQGIYIDFWNKSFLRRTDELGHIVDIIDRAFTTRSMLSGIFHEIVTLIIREVGILDENRVIYYLNSKYINPVTIKNIVSLATNLPVTIDDDKIIIDTLVLDKDTPRFFGAVKEYSSILDELFVKIENEAKARKRHTLLYCYNPTIRAIMFQLLKRNGFYCETDGAIRIYVDWSTPPAQIGMWGFAHKCWLYYNTECYYRACVASITRRLKANPSDTDFTFSKAKTQIDNKYFEQTFNDRQSFRCYPIQTTEDKEHPYRVFIKTDYDFKTDTQKRKGVKS